MTGAVAEHVIEVLVMYVCVKELKDGCEQVSREDESTIV